MAGLALPEINAALYIYIFVQTFLFVPFVAVLAVVRGATARRWSRAFGFLAMVAAVAVLAVQFGPAFLRLYDGPFPVFAGQATRALDGLALPLAPSLSLLVSAFVPGRRFWTIDALHIVALLGFIGLYVYTQMV